jgi:hypothetical protein
MKNRVLRVSDETWEAAQAAAARRGEKLSEQIRAFLEEYPGRDQCGTCTGSGMVRYLIGKRTTSKVCPGCGGTGITPN